ncbi:MAG: DUF2782 domain-containing protein [Methylophilaceae bacterium]|nr:DUF2782 domain-containing protein [Methylophilaceae bacterium]
MRRLRLFLAVTLMLPMLAWAADDVPPDLEPLPEVPPPPAVLDGAGVDEPEVTIIQRDEETVEEYRINGELYMLKITPKHGVPYYLQKEDQDGGWSRFDGPSPPLSIPKWVIFRF